MALNWEIFSTGGTYELLKQSGLKELKKIEELTGFPEIMEGRVKTLHPVIYGGILSDRKKEEHMNQAKEHGMPMIDMVVCNLYPFEKVSADPEKTEEEILENIDIGGVTLLRAAAKNHKSVWVLCHPSDYPKILEYLRESEKMKRKYALKAYQYTSSYDGAIGGYLKGGGHLRLDFQKKQKLRYGENAHQEAMVYEDQNPVLGSVLSAKILQGKKLSYNNLLDGDAALNLIREFGEPTVAVLKHTNPCGCASSDQIEDAFRKAYDADILSAFGGIIVMNRPCSKEIAEKVNQVFVEMVIAPKFFEAAFEILKKKKNLRLLEVGEIIDFIKMGRVKDYKKIVGGVLEQDLNQHGLSEEDLEVVSWKEPSVGEMNDLLFAWKVVKYVKSNAIVLVKDQVTLGIGAGQMSRVDAVEIAVRKAGAKARGAVVASDGFFPFRDSIDKFSQAGIVSVIQPGGSIKDEEVKKAVNEHGLSMVFTHIRSFRH